MKEVPLTQGKVALVDDEDYKRVMQFAWRVELRSDHKTYYARRNVIKNGRRTNQFLHRFILDAPDDLDVDHRNNDGFDCQKHNLRYANHSQNQANRKVPVPNKTGFKGVRQQRKRWVAAITANQVHTHLGTFDRPEMAARAYDNAAKIAFGEFARLNFPERTGHE